MFSARAMLAHSPKVQKQTVVIQIEEEESGQGGLPVRKEQQNTVEVQHFPDAWNWALGCQGPSSNAQTETGAGREKCKREKNTSKGSGEMNRFTWLWCGCN